MEETCRPHANVDGPLRGWRSGDFVVGAGDGELGCAGLGDEIRARAPGSTPSRPPGALGQRGVARGWDAVSGWRWRQWRRHARGRTTAENSTARCRWRRSQALAAMELRGWRFPPAWQMAMGQQGKGGDGGSRH